MARLAVKMVEGGSGSEAARERSLALLAALEGAHLAVLDMQLTERENSEESARLHVGACHRVACLSGKVGLAEEAYHGCFRRLVK
eukprot:scaffold285827_cov37-Prasinocladus_malaysianus.AAC.3